MQRRRAAAVSAVVALLLAVVPAIARGADQAETPWYGTDAGNRPTVRLYFFWTETCPHCRRARPFVADLKETLPWLEVRSLRLAEDTPDAVALFLAMTEALGDPAAGVPAFLFCGAMVVGFDEAATTGTAMRRDLIACHDRLTAASATAPVTAPKPAAAALEPIALPLFGAVDPHAVSLPLLTVMIAVVDAFNPCAFFVLMFLMSLLVHSRDRRRMAVIGGLFVLASGVMYFAFMAAWLNLFLVLGELTWVTTAAALVALLLGAVNIKDFFLGRRGVSLGIPEAAKPGLFARMRSLTAAESWPVLLLGAVTLAVAANTYELLCTAGLPMLFTRLLTVRELAPADHYLYLVLYNVVYVLPLLGLAVVFVVTLGSRKLQEGEGRTLKLLSGLMMTGLGLALLLKPEVLSDVRVAVGLVLAAIAAAVTIAGVERLRTVR